VTFGLKTAEVKGVVVCWMADVRAIRHAACRGANLIIAHESPFFPYNAGKAGNAPEHMTWHANLNRVSLLAQSGVAVIRTHLPMDNYCIIDEFAKKLALGRPSVCVRPPGVALTLKAYDIERVSYGELIKDVKEKLSLKTVRATPGDPDRPIGRLGVPWGGIGLFVNVGQTQSFIDMGCEALITGESDNYGFRFAADAGCEMIEVGHEVSENFGIEKFARDLACKLPQIPVEFYENMPPFDFY
ncbi:MAG: Nif3-like dinuclear metal center hexameric protein, partial [Defluviitaleaceae bacterium]|nr:Nif3-like dinuclear metal center hexameric protein [Defluviitaleaceae bacterium]